MPVSTRLFMNNDQSLPLLVCVSAIMFQSEERGFIAYTRYIHKHSPAS